MDNYTKLGLEKLAEDDNAGKKGAAGVGAGALGLYKSAPHITGRDRLYHGTTEEGYKNILKDGIKGKFTGKKGLNTDILKDKNPEAYKKSLGKTFATKSPLQGRLYEAQSKAGGVEKATKNPAELAKNFSLTGKHTAKINAPTWKMDTVSNPEIGGQTFKQWKKGKGGFFGPSDRQLKSMYKELKDGTVTFDGDIPSKYIKGSKDYKRAGLKEIKNYAKNNPKRFAGGAALGTLGALGTGYGVKKLYDKFKSKKEEK